MIAPTLTTQRLSIEPMSLAHWEAYAAAWADPRMTEFIGGEPRSRNTSWGKFLTGIGLWSLLGYGYWSFVERASGRFVGNGGLAQFERGIPELEGYPEAGWAFAADALGQGLCDRGDDRDSGMGGTKKQSSAKSAASSTPATMPHIRWQPNWVSSKSPNRTTSSVTCSFIAVSRALPCDKLCITPPAGLPLH